MLCETSFYAERYLLGRKSAHAELEESLLGRKSAHAEGVLLGSESAYAEGVLHFVELYDRKLSFLVYLLLYWKSSLKPRLDAIHVKPIAGANGPSVMRDIK